MHCRKYEGPFDQETAKCLEDTIDVSSLEVNLWNRDDALQNQISRCFVESEIILIYFNEKHSDAKVIRDLLHFLVNALKGKQYSRVF